MSKNIYTKPQITVRSFAINHLCTMSLHQEEATRIGAKEDCLPLLDDEEYLLDEDDSENE